MELKKLWVKANVHELNAQRCRYQMTVNLLRESLAAWNDKPLEPFYNLLPVVIDPVKGNTINFSQSIMLPQCLGAISPGTDRRSNTLTKIRALLTLGRSLSMDRRDLNLGELFNVNCCLPDIILSGSGCREKINKMIN